MQVLSIFSGWISQTQSSTPWSYD